MTRAFLDQPLEDSQLDALIDLARRSPAAGNTAGVEYLVLTGNDTTRYWDTTLAPERRADFPWPRLLAAPAIIVPWVDPEAYVARYGEADKARTGLGADVAAWQVPYWWVDGGMAAMSMLLAAEAAGLGALFFGLFEHEGAVRTVFGVPDGRRAVGAIAVGHRAPDPRRSASAARGRPALDTIIHRGRW
jgi:nitroreductase